MFQETETGTWQVCTWEFGSHRSTALPRCLYFYFDGHPVLIPISASLASGLEALSGRREGRRHHTDRAAVAVSMARCLKRPRPYRALQGPSPWRAVGAVSMARCREDVRLHGAPPRRASPLPRSTGAVSMGRQGEGHQFHRASLDPTRRGAPPMDRILFPQLPHLPCSKDVIIAGSLYLLLQILELGYTF